MSCLGNILWFIFGGFFNALGWFACGILWCITIIGIPVGLQCFKMGRLQLAPFGKENEELLRASVDFASNAVVCYLQNGLQIAQNKFN